MPSPIRALMAWLVCSGTSARACPQTELRDSVAAALDGWVERDLEGFQRAHLAAREALSCQESPVPLDLARDLHLVAAMAAYLPPREADRVRADLRGVLAVEPGYALPVAIAAPGSLFHQLYDDARVAVTPIEEQPVLPAGCILLVDGQPAPRPRHRPAIVQLSCAGGELRESLRLAEADPLPAWSDPTTTPPSQRRPLAVGLGVGAGVSLAAATGLWIGALSERGNYRELVDTLEAGGLSPSRHADLKQHRARANTLGYAAEAATFLGVGLTGATLVVIW